MGTLDISFYSSNFQDSFSQSLSTRAFVEMAENYKLNGASVSELCDFNANVANNVGKPQVIHSICSPFILFNFVSFDLISSLQCLLSWGEMLMFSLHACLSMFVPLFNSAELFSSLLIAQPEFNC